MSFPPPGFKFSEQEPIAMEEPSPDEKNAFPEALPGVGVPLFEPLEVDPKREAELQPEAEADAAALAAGEVESKLEADAPDEVVLDKEEAQEEAEKREKEEEAEERREETEEAKGPLTREAEQEMDQKRSEDERGLHEPLTPELEPAPLAESAMDNPLEGIGEQGELASFLPVDLREQMEQSFAVNFSGVKVFRGSKLAEENGARAFAMGEELHFAPGAYNPETPEGQQLIGHELAHVVQQRKGKVRPDPSPEEVYPAGIAVNTDSGLEQEADEKGAAAAQGKQVSTGGTPAGPLQSAPPVAQGWMGALGRALAGAGRWVMRSIGRAPKRRGPVGKPVQAPQVPRNPYLTKPQGALEKSKRSFERLLKEHKKKLRDYKQNPDAFDNLGKLKQVPPEVRQRIVRGRILELQRQMEKHKGELKKIEKALKQSGK
ncbi:MAG: DUF4157 domain-containing protein [Bacteroidota bacterium]